MFETFPPPLDFRIAAQVEERKVSFISFLKSQRENFHIQRFVSGHEAKGLKPVERENEINTTAEPLNYPVIHFLFSTSIRLFYFAILRRNKDGNNFILI